MKALLTLALAFASSAAFAWTAGNERANGPTNVHVYSYKMKCAAVQTAVANNGAVILHYGKGLYERVVTDGSYCNSAARQFAEAFWAPTKDNAQCFVGYTCEDSNGGGSNGG